MGLHPWGSAVRFVWGRGEFAWAKPIGLGNEAQDLQPVISQGSVSAPCPGPTDQQDSGASHHRSHQELRTRGHHVLSKDQAASVPGSWQVTGI